MGLSVAIPGGKVEDSGEQERTGDGSRGLLLRQNRPGGAKWLRLQPVACKEWAEACNSPLGWDDKGGADLATNSFNAPALGRKYYARAKDRYSVSFPTIVNVTRTNGSIYQRQDWLPSTALPSLGEIKVSRELSEAQQIAEVRRKVQEFLLNHPRDYIDAAGTQEAELLLPGN